jgi:O-methyltransferase
MRSQIDITPDLLDYLRDVSLRDDDILKDLRAETAGRPDAIMQILPEEAQFLAFLIRLTGARRILEIGTYTGYSALCMARALPSGGLLVTCDIDPEPTAVAQRYWKRAGVTDKIDLRLADARDTLPALLGQYGPDSFDLAFIDADKAGYPHYYQHAKALIRPGGLIVIDNTLWSGRVIDPTDHHDDTLGIRHINQILRDDQQIDLVLLPMADGVTLVRKPAA